MFQNQKLGEKFITNVNDLDIHNRESDTYMRQSMLATTMRTSLVQTYPPSILTADLMLETTPMISMRSIWMLRKLLGLQKLCMKSQL